MLEYQTDSPILGVDIGRLVGDSGVYLAILHPRKVVVCSVSVDTTTKDTGTFYNVSQVYSHKLERTACNMCLGSFGSVKSKYILLYRLFCFFFGWTVLGIKIMISDFVRSQIFSCKMSLIFLQ